MARTKDAPLLDGLLDWGGVASLGHLEVYRATQPGEIVKRAAAASVVLTNKTPLSAETIAGPMILHEVVGGGVTPFLRMRLPYLASSPVMTTAKAPRARS